MDDLKRLSCKNKCYGDDYAYLNQMKEARLKLKREDRQVFEDIDLEVDFDPSGDFRSWGFQFNPPEWWWEFGPYAYEHVYLEGDDTL